MIKNRFLFKNRLWLENENIKSKSSWIPTRKLCFHFLRKLKENPMLIRVLQASISFRRSDFHLQMNSLPTL